MYQSIMMEAKALTRLTADDYKVDRYWETVDTKGKRVFQVVRVSGMDVFFRECVTEKSGRKVTPVGGKFASPTQFTAKRMGAYSLSVFDTVNNVVLSIRPMPLPKAEEPMKYPEWKVGAIVVASFGATMKRNAFFEITERKGITVTLQQRHSKVVEDLGYDVGTETVADGFVSGKQPIKVRISKSSIRDGYVKLSYGMFGELWDGKPVQFYGD